MVHIDGHELGIIATVTGLYGVTNGVLGKGWVKQFIHRQPVAVFSVAIACFGLAMPVVITPIRRKFGLPTNQYEGNRPGTIFPNYE